MDGSARNVVPVKPHLTRATTPTKSKAGPPWQAHVAQNGSHTRQIPEAIQSTSSRFWLPSTASAERHVHTPVISPSHFLSGVK